MKLKPHTYKSWWDLHAWGGLLCSLVVYLFFFFGTVTLFHSELSMWQEAHGPIPSLAEVDHILDQHLADGSVSSVSLRLNFPRPRSPWFSIGYKDGAGVDQGKYIERQGFVEPRSNVADFLYGMHYLQFPGAPAWLYTLAGLLSGVLLLVVVTGVLIHLRDIVRQFHQFRPHKKLQVLWSDSHKVLGTIGLPFAAVYAFTGAWMGLDEPLTASVTEAVFRGDSAAVQRAMNGAPQAPDVIPSGVAAARLPLAELFARAEAARPPAEPASASSPDCRAVYLNDIGDRDAIALFYCGDNDITLRQRDGLQIVSEAPPAPTAARRISEIPYAMHFVEFAQMPLRVLYALLGIAGCLAILTGNWLWLERRSPDRGTRLVRWLTLAVGAGTLVASAAMLVASRFGISAAFENGVYWWSWLAVVAVCGLGRDKTALWRRFGVLAGVLLGVASLPGIAGSWLGEPIRSPTVRNVDAALLALGVALVLLARRLRPSEASPSRRGVLSHAEPADVR